MKWFWCVCVLSGACLEGVEAAARDLVLLEAGSTRGAAELLHADEISEEQHGELRVLNAPPDRDPYHKREWLLRFRSALPAAWKTLVLEVSFFDEGAGVIQPVLLQDDALDGTWAAPLRAASFTRLNTQKLRRAYFEFPLQDLDWTHTGNVHLKIAGLQHLYSLRAFPGLSKARWKAAEESVPLLVEPLVTLARPMQINCTVGIPDTGNPPSLELALNNIREYAPLARLLGFTSAECFVRWDLIEPRPGEFDFHHYDVMVDALEKRGLKWFPNLVVTSAFALPAWYYDSAENVPLECLEHGEKNQVPSIWNAANRAHVQRVLKAFGDHYEKRGVLEAVRLGPSGNFGEAQYPAGAGAALGYHGEKMHAHIGWWAGDALARDDFQQYLRQKYGSIAGLNTSWAGTYTGFEEIVPQLPERYQARQGRLDMTAWYTDAMSAWCGFWAESTRAALPNTPIYQSSGGWGYREAGTDFTAQAESMQPVHGGIRLTNETDSFEQNFYATRLAATAARLYGLPLGYEPAGYHSARGTAARFFSTATTNGTNLYTRHGVLFTDPYAVDVWLRDIPLLDLRGKPLVEVAVYYPETMNQLDDGAFRNLYGWGFNPRAAEVRRRVDCDFLDERLIRAGFLDRYKVLVFCWGNVIEPDVQAHIDQWLRAGGTVLYPSYPRGPQETVAGDTKLFNGWQRGDTGQGIFRRFPGDMEPIDLYGDFVATALRESKTLHPWTRRLLEAKRPPHLFLSVLEDGSVLALNYNDHPEKVEIADLAPQELEAYSTRCIGKLPSEATP